MAAGEPITVVVVDDEAIVRRGLVLLLGADPGIRVVAEAQSGREALDVVADFQPQVVLMDVRMPGGPGFQAVEALMSKASRAPAAPAVLMLTTFDDGDAVIESIRHGAAGFMLKSAAPSDLLEAVRVVAEGGTWLDPLATGHVFQALTSLPRFSVPAPQLASLTPREVEVLRHIGLGASNAEIAADLHLSQSTVKTHVSSILSKLGLKDRTMATVAAYQTGLVTVPGTRGGTALRRPK